MGAALIDRVVVFMAPWSVMLLLEKLGLLLVVSVAPSLVIVLWTGVMVVCRSVLTTQ